MKNNQRKENTELLSYFYLIFILKFCDLAYQQFQNIFPLSKMAYKTQFSCILHRDYK